VQQKIGGGRLYLGAEDEEQLKFERFLRFDTFDPFNSGEDWHNLKATLLPNITILDNLTSVNNFDPLIPDRYSAWMDALEEVGPQVKSQMLNLMGVTVVESIDLNSIYGVRFDSREAYPLLRWVSCGVQVEDEEVALDLIRSGKFDFNSQVVLEESEGVDQVACSDQAGVELELHDDTSSKTDVLVNSQTDGYLVLADAWYPGWQVAVDGNPATLLHANYLFKALFVPAGEHEIEIYYYPRSFYIGAILTTSGVLLLAVVLIIWNRLKLF
jgi:hypothetical protein